MFDIFLCLPRSSVAVKSICLKGCQSCEAQLWILSSTTVKIKISHLSFNSELEIIRFSCNFNTCQVQRILTLNHVKQATPSFFMDVRIVVKVGVKNQKNLLFTCKWWNHQLAEDQHGKHILSVVNHSKTREQSFGMNFSYALNGTHNDWGPMWPP